MWGPYLAQILKLISEIGDAGHKLKNHRINKEVKILPGPRLRGRMCP